MIHTHISDRQQFFYIPVAIQYYPEFKQYYKRKKAEGKHSMSVLNAIRNKIILRAAAVVNNQKAYVDNTEQAARNSKEKHLDKS